MKGIIIIAHGSRKPETKTVFKQVMAYFEQELAKGKIPVSAVAYCFLEFAEPNLKQALHDFVQKGIDDIKAGKVYSLDTVEKEMKRDFGV